jgi:hypothetical protein
MRCRRRRSSLPGRLVRDATHSLLPKRQMPSTHTCMVSRRVCCGRGHDCRSARRDSRPGPGVELGNPSCHCGRGRHAVGLPAVPAHTWNTKFEIPRIRLTLVPLSRVTMRRHSIRMFSGRDHRLPLDLRSSTIRARSLPPPRGYFRICTDQRVRGEGYRSSAHESAHALARQVANAAA